MHLDETNLFQTVVANAARHFNILKEYVEKDYWLTKILKNIFQYDYGYVFKGGTSLSKCFHVINRFSEDIDISYSESYLEAKITDTNRRFKGISASIKNAGLLINNKDKLRRSRYFNRFICPYNSLFNEVSIQKAVVVELAAQTPSFPNEVKTIQSFVGTYLEESGRHDLVEQYELQSFEVVTQKLERTFVDKVFAICDYYLSNKCEKHSRHLYDLTKIVQNIRLDESVAELFKEVRKYRFDNPICPSAKEGIKLFNIIYEIIKNKPFQKDYNKTTFSLLYESVPYHRCEDNLSVIKNFLKKFDI